LYYFQLFEHFLNHGGMVGAIPERHEGSILHIWLWFSASRLRIVFRRGIASLL